MKTYSPHFLYSVLVIWCMMSHAWGQNAVSIEQFKKIPDPDERLRIIEQAPQEQKDALQKIDKHLSLLSLHGGVMGLKEAKESEAARVRGFKTLELAYYAYLNLWSSYINGVDAKMAEAGIPHDQQAEREQKLLDEMAVRGKQYQIIHTLTVNLAPTPQALKLEAEVSAMLSEFDRKDGGGSSTPHAVTEAERVKADHRMDHLVEELRHLPALSPAQVQKECDEVSEAGMK